MNVQWPAIVGLSLCLFVFGCGKQGGPSPLRVDTLSVERDQVLMIHHLPLGISQNEARLRFPSMGEIRNELLPGQALTGVASGTMRVMDGREATVEMKFENDVLVSYALLVSADSLFGTTTYQRLQGLYTMQFGNYHQEVREEGTGRRMRSTWTSDAFAVALVLLDSSGLHTLQWGFEKLPPVTNEQPEADVPRPYYHVPLAVFEE